MPDLNILRDVSSICFIPFYKLNLKNQLGEGASSCVYECTIDDKDYVAKVIKSDNYEDVEDYLYELNLASTLLDTKHIIHFKGFSYEKLNEDYFYYIIIMEKLNCKGDLYDYIQNEAEWSCSRNYNNLIVPEPLSNYVYYNSGDDVYWSYHLPLDTKIKIVKSFANALLELHNKGVVHGDLKTNNIVLHHINNEPSIKIIDLGTATLTKEKTLFKIESKYGTEGYRAPEQDKYKLHYKSDVYSWGITVIEIWNGEIWKDGKTFQQTRMEALSGLRTIEKYHKDLGKLLRKTIQIPYHKRPYINTIVEKLNNLQF
tara:strand:- start:43 stop:984 length:942 start_codon:yes stop_codon:yes gene_type:complete